MLENLLKKIKRYNHKADLEKIKKAYDFAKSIHSNQKRASGEPFIIHPLAVAELVVDLNLDEDSVCAALLHDVIEESEGKVTLSDIEKNFGLEIALIVDGLTNFRETVKRFPVHRESLDNLRKLLLASVDDIRVLIVRLADKIHNGRTIKFLPKDRQKKFAQRVFSIYSPLAEFISLWVFKRELEDIAFKVLYPDDYLWLKKNLKSSQEKSEKILEKLIKEINEALAGRKINGVDIFGRTKGLWSTWCKIQKYVESGRISRKDSSVVLDVIGVSVLVDDVDTCYAVLGVIHSIWEYLPDSFDDYISRPKPNGYQALQTTVLVNDTFAEVQIKTRKMHEYNEFGPASHIAYKIAGGKNVSNYSYGWVKELVRWKNGEKQRQFKIRVFEKYVYILTPKGDIIQLQKEATPIDFAYRIHTSLGNSCRGVKVNEKMVRLDYELQNGDLVEILVNPRQKHPKQKWLEFAKTKEARDKIKKALA